MRDSDDLFRALKQSRFRSRFHLGPREREYVRTKGLDRHDIPRGEPLTDEQQAYVVGVIAQWLRDDIRRE